MMKELSLAGKTVMVTGAARRVGRMLALACARAGADIIIHHGHSAHEALQLQEEIASFGHRVWVLAADLSNPDEVSRLISQAQEFAPLQKEVAHNPMIATLAGQIMRANKSDKGLIEFYRNATQNFPQHRALTYDYVELLLQGLRYDDALKLLNEQIISHPSDPRLYELQARSYSALGKRQDEHHALAYTYALHGNLYGAIEQLELVKQAGTDYYQLSTIESELKQFREIAAAHRK